MCFLSEISSLMKAGSKMNDRLKISTMVVQGMFSGGRLNTGNIKDIVADAVKVADALLAAAGEQAMELTSNNEGN